MKQESIQASILIATIVINFIGINVYSLIFDIITIKRSYEIIFYWGVETLCISVILVISGMLSKNKIIEISINTFTIFYLIKGIYKIVKISSNINEYIWITFCSGYTLLSLIIIFIWNRKQQRK